MCSDVLAFHMRTFEEVCAVDDYWYGDRPSVLTF